MLFSRCLTRRIARACAIAVLLISPAAHAQSSLTFRSGDTLRLSLGDAVSIAMRQSDEVGISAAQVDVADALYGGARANLLPQLRLNTSYLHVYESARGQAVGTQFNQPNTYTGNLNLSQTLFQGGRLISATRAADELRKAARFDEREQRSQLTLQVERAYLQVLFADRMAELQDRNLALASSRLTQVEQFERAARALELLDLCQPARRECQIPVLEFGHAIGEEHLEICALDLQRELRALLALVEPRSLAKLIRRARRRDEPAALKQRLGEVEIAGVGVRLIELRADRLASRALVHMQVRSIQPKLRKEVGSSAPVQCVGDIHLRGGNAHLVTLPHGDRHGISERQPKRVAGPKSEG